MNIFILLVMFILMAGIAAFFCNLLHLNPAEGMIPAVFVIIVTDLIATGLVGSYFVALIPAALLSACGLGLSIYRWFKNGKIQFNFILSPYFIALTSVFVISLFIYHGDLIKNIDELSLWAIADRYMCMNDKLYIYEDYAYIQGSSLFRYFFLRSSGFNEGNLYAVSALLYWIGLLLPFGKLKVEKSPRILLYILLMHIGLYSMYCYGSKSCGPELALACWTGGLAGWWITRLEKKKADIVVMTVGLLVSSSFTTSIDISLVLFVVLLVLFLIAGDFITNKTKSGTHEINIKDVSDTTALKENTGLYRHIDMYCGIAAMVIIIAVIIGYGFITGFTYLTENMTGFLKCLVERNMSLGRSDLNYTFIFNIALVAVLYVATVDRKEQRLSAVRYTLYSIVVSVIYIAVLIYGIVDADVHVEKDYRLEIQRLIAVLVIYLFVMALAWLLCEERMLEKKTPYIPGLILLVVFMYGVNARYLTNTTAAYPEKSANYAVLQQVIRECDYLQKAIPSNEKIYMINQGKEIAGAEAKFLLFDRVSDFSADSWKFSVNGGMVGHEIEPYKSIDTLPSVLTKGKYSYVWIHKTDEYLNTHLPLIMGDEMLENSFADMNKKSVSRKQATVKLPERLINSESIVGGQLYRVGYKKKKAWVLNQVRNIVLYDTRKDYYRWNDIID